MPVADEITVPIDDKLQRCDIQIDRDIRRRNILVSLFLQRDMTEFPSGDFWYPVEWKLKKLPQGSYLDRPPLLAIRYEDAQALVEELHKSGFRTESSDEKDARIEELKQHIDFLEAVVFKKLEITKQDVEQFRLIRSS